ncbi:hypothetical protein WOLCODRAFT_74096, partial [Wolfiporia cocos MD-104 SS10]
LVIYEHAITLSAEYDLVWRRRLTSVSIVFLLNRYTTLAWSILSYVMIFAHASTSCDNVSRTWFVCMIVWECLWAALGAARVYAISGRKWILSVLTLALGLIDPGTNIVSSLRS